MPGHRLQSDCAAVRAFRAILFVQGGGVDPGLLRAEVAAANGGLGAGIKARLCAAHAKTYGCHGDVVAVVHSRQLSDALDHVITVVGLALIDLWLDPIALTPRKVLSEITSKAQKGLEPGFASTG